MKRVTNIAFILILIGAIGVGGLKLNNSILENKEKELVLAKEIKSLEEKVEGLEVSLENSQIEEENGWKEVSETIEEEVEVKAKEEIKETEAIDDISSRIDNLINEKKSIIARKKVSRDGREQKELGMRIGEIEREISKLKRGR